ncbi:MAG TPA: L-threonylcarbamoyladenylate synthase [Geminicoccaceae bacterium]|nr:L-threonylcarbamoyladenylate synthase [Geminicoccus sp.]HMU48827.1 L-threonylcarbamoyladenylate synthase [Geminicoccaceae bacterium]
MTLIVEPTPAGIGRAARLLREGRLVAFPTETVYGLGALATSDTAVAATFAAKGRPRHNPLIVHVADSDAAGRLGRFDERAARLARAFWPGPLTLVLPLIETAGISALATAGLSTVAVRVPGHPVAQALLRETAAPVTAPSANPSGRVSPTTAAHVAEDLGDRLALVLDGGACQVGVESTVVDLSGGTPRLLRPGGLGRAAIERLVGPLGDPVATTAPSSPGQLPSHYAPRLPVRLDALDVRAGEALLAFGPEVPEGAVAVRNLSPSGDVAEAAANLFAMLRELDASGAGAIAVMPVPTADGLGEAIGDRLRRAAAPR